MDDRKKASDDRAGRGGTFLDERDAGGHSLPESERDKARMRSGRDDGSGEDASTAHPGTIPPPD